jgi:AcrR family transcriptional regulator
VADQGTKKRSYRMRARAESAAQTGERILDAALAALAELPLDEVNLAAVADRAGVTVQTVLRRYGSKSRLFEVAIARIAVRVNEHRGSTVAGDVPGAMRILVEHYEEMGDLVLRLLAEEVRHPALGAMADIGRRYHRHWCERVFAPWLEELPDGVRERRVAQLAALTDVYVWKVMRRDQGLATRETEAAMVEVVEALLERSP